MRSQVKSSLDLIWGARGKAVLCKWSQEISQDKEAWPFVRLDQSHWLPPVGGGVNCQVVSR